jgi:hypothetical protein
MMTPAGREALWALSVRFAIEAASEAEARAVLGQVLAASTGNCRCRASR